LSNMLEIEKEIERIDQLISSMKERRKKLREAQKRFKLPHYCPFCASSQIVKPPEIYRGEEIHLLKGYYLCKNCDRAFKMHVVTHWKKKIIKEAIERR